MVEHELLGMQPTDRPTDLSAVRTDSAVVDEMTGERVISLRQSGQLVLYSER